MLNTNKDLFDIHSDRPLGCLVAPPPANVLRLSSYVDVKKVLAATAYSDVPAAPSWRDFRLPDGRRPKADTDPLGNNVYGNCVYAAPGHYVNLIGQHTGNPFLSVTRDMVNKAYFDATGGVDRGYYTARMLDQWKDKPLYGTSLLGYCSINPRDRFEIALGVWLAGGLIGGFALPLASQGQIDNQGRQLWYKPESGWPEGKGPSTWGGHCMFLRGTSPNIDDYNSWGEDTESTAEWTGETCFELYMAIIKEWTPNGMAPNGVALADLLADMRSRQ